MSGSFQTIQFEFVVGDEGIDPTGGIRFELPVAYAETEHYFWSKPQTENLQGLGYVSATTSNGAKVILKTYGLSGGIFECTIVDKPLKKGDTIVAQYKGLVQTLTWDVEIRHAIRRSGDEPWIRVSNPPYFNIIPEKAHTIIVSMPSDVEKGEAFDLAIVLIDKYGNRAENYRNTVQLKTTDVKATLETQYYTFTEKDKGVHVFKNCRFLTGGFHKIWAQDTSSPLKESWHYTFVWEKEPELHRYFGDTHFHTGTGTNHAGFFALEDQADVNELSLEDFQKLNAGGDHRANFTNARDSYAYVRDVMRLDFASSSEHDVALFDNIAWKESQQITTDFNDPGRFTTFYAYEWTPGFNHHIVIHKQPNAKIFYREETTSLTQLWHELDKQGKPAITIPHLTWQFEDHIAWENINNKYRRIGEIYSLWNSRFLILPDDQPQRFELGKDNKWSYHYAWAKGHKVGLIGSTDNHLGHPGSNNYSIYTHHTGGLAAVVASKNNREDLWESMHDRRTYGTSGTKIYVDFKINGFDMGTEFETSSLPIIIAKIAGTNDLKSVEIVKYVDGRYKTIYQENPKTPIAQFTYTDVDFKNDTFYYLRVTQIEEYLGRPYSHSTSEMAWSSPIWVNIKD
ncbi:MAG: DUF3604 domain-containing protein [Verrucomicrobia bacterium]|nr:DUF3604 domain-containing protein [Verrucomicrobiota bacterium]